MNINSAKRFTTAFNFNKALRTDKTHDLPKMLAGNTCTATSKQLIKISNIKQPSNTAFELSTTKESLSCLLKLAVATGTINEIIKLPKERDSELLHYKFQFAETKHQCKFYNSIMQYKDQDT